MIERIKGKYQDLAIISLIVGLFLCMTVGTIEKYGLDYDAGNHMVRGEYLLHFYLTGETDYTNLPIDQRCRFQLPDPDYFYHSPVYTFEWYKGGTSLGDLSSAVTCSVFYKYLKWLDPVDAHNMATILYAAISIFILYFFALEAFGRKTAIMSAVFLALYPTFIGYSHVCIKDLPVFCFVTLTIWLFWKGALKNRYKLIWLSIISLGLGMVAKMNAVYAVIILLPWVLILIKNKTGIFAKLSIKFWITLISSPLITVLIFLFFAPKIWIKQPYEFAGNLKSAFNEMVGIISYVSTKGKAVSPKEIIPASNNINKIKQYKKIEDQSPGHKRNKVNIKKKENPPPKNNYKQLSPTGGFLRQIFYAPLHAFITMPFSLFLFALGGVWFIVRRKVKAYGGADWLVLSWAVSPVGFCMLPFVFIHSGIREFLPFVAGVCLLAGLGVETLHETLIQKYRLNREKSLMLFIGMLTVITLPVLVSIMQYHPYELAFVNRMIGGLKGAQEFRLPSSNRVGIPQVGDTRGSSFRNAINWVDEQAGPSSVIVIWATSSKFVPRKKNIYIIPNGWDSYKADKLSLRQRKFNTVYIIFNRTYWNLLHPVYGYCYKNLTPVYTIKANDVPISYVYRMNREEFFKIIY